MDGLDEAIAELERNAADLSETVERLLRVIDVELAQTQHFFPEQLLTERPQ